MMKLTNKTINIKIPIETDEYLREFIFKNINYSRFVWNDFVEEANKFKGINCMYYGFNPRKFKTEYFKTEDDENIYEEMCVGISDQIASKMLHTLNGIRNHNTTNKIKKLMQLRFHSFDRYYGSFKISNQATITKSKDKNISNRIHVKDKYTLTFRVRGGDSGRGVRYKKEHLTIHLKEPLFKYNGVGYYYPSFVREYKVKNENTVECWFNELDIRETCFIHKLGKFYIQLSVNVTYIIEDKDIKSRQRRAGIDTGIHNPAVIYFGRGRAKEIKMPQNVSNKLHYLERRAKRLQNIKDMKLRINKERVKRGELDSPYTNNYWKVMYKFRKVWDKIVNIKLYWIYTECKKIVTSFQVICVDRFSQPDNNSLKGKLKRRYNYHNRFHKMYTFNEILKHMADKYGCLYVEAPPRTTCTCSYCSTEYEEDTNDLRIREFTCMNKDCVAFGRSIDRDFNAARNCYKYAKKYL